MGALVEGIESITLVCSIVLFLPALGALLLGRRPGLLTATWIMTGWLMAIARFALVWTEPATGARHSLTGLLLVGLAWAAWQDGSTYNVRVAIDIALVAMTSALVTWTWVPCVGSELGNIINGARTDPWPQVLPTLLFMTGLFLPMIAIAAATNAWPKLADIIDRWYVRRAGIALIALVGALVAVTLYDDVAAELARRSSL